jgi:hypothetical protein
MATLAHRKKVQGQDKYYVFWWEGDRRRERCYEGCKSIDEMYARILKEPGMEDVSRVEDVPLSLLGKRWDGDRWIVD